MVAGWLMKLFTVAALSALLIPAAVESEALICCYQEKIGKGN